MLRERKVECRANIFKPLGYENLHVYVNTLAGSASGDWLFFWNDDGVMVTDGWDEVIRRYTGQFKLLAPHDNHNGHPYAIFPIVPRDWFMLLDHLSQNAQNDAWLSHIAYMLDIFERIDVEFIHDRADITGNNNDPTFQNRKYMEGNPSDPKDFGEYDIPKESFNKDMIFQDDNERGIPDFHGYYCINAEPSVTIYKLESGELFQNINKNNRAILSETGLLHGRGYWKENSKRITLGYSIQPADSFDVKEKNPYTPLVYKK